MESIITLVLPYIAPSALPLIIVILGITYIQSKRKETKNERDKDSQNLHDDILKLKFDVQALKDDKVLVHTVQTDLQEQVNQLTTAVAKLSVSVEQFSEAVKELREDIKDMRKK